MNVILMAPTVFQGFGERVQGDASGPNTPVRLSAPGLTSINRPNSVQAEIGDIAAPKSLTSFIYPGPIAGYGSTTFVRDYHIPSRFLPTRAAAAASSATNSTAAAIIFEEEAPPVYCLSTKGASAGGNAQQDLIDLGMVISGMRVDAPNFLYNEQLNENVLLLSMFVS